MARYLTWLLIPLAVALLTGAGCSRLQGDDETFVIPDTYVAADETYTLLYSTIGYDLGGTKRVLIRLNDPDAPVSVGLAFQWRLVADDGRVVKVGNASYDGDAWGIPIWIADFSDVDEPGTYRMALEAPEATLATDAFPVEDFLLFRRTFVPVALDNAEVRAAPIEDDNGFYEDTSIEGTAAAHGEFLMGLLAVYEARRPSMTDAMRQRTRAAISRALEYLLLVSDPATGQFAHTAPTRPYQGFDPNDTLVGTRALARYAAEFQGEDPATADRAYRRARMGEEWILDNEEEIYTVWARAAIAYDFYRYTSDEEQLERAAESVREIANEYDLRTMDRSSYDTSAHLETMFRMWRDVPSHPDRPLWEEAALAIGEQYAEFVERNPFDVIAPGIDEGDDTPAEQWDAMESEPPPGEGMDAIIGNEWFLARVADAVYLSRITDDDSLAEAAAGSLLWVSGLNPGIDVARVADDGVESPLVAASFLTGLDASTVQASPEWQWQRSRPIGTIVGGFRRAFVFDDAVAASAPSIVRDGLWLKALVLYEDLLHPAGRAEHPIETAPVIVGSQMRIAIVEGEQSDDQLELTLDVVGPDGAPLADALVTVAWRSVAVEGLPIEATIFVTTCETQDDGGCTVTLVVDDLDGELPIAAVVTSLEHEDHASVPSAETLGEPWLFD